MTDQENKFNSPIVTQTKKKSLIFRLLDIEYK